MKFNAAISQENQTTLQKFFDQKEVKQEDYNKIVAATGDEAKYIKIYARHIAHSIFNTAKGKLFQNALNTKVKDEFDKFAIESKNTYDAVKALGLAYTAFRLGNKESGLKYIKNGEEEDFTKTINTLTDKKEEVKSEKAGKEEKEVKKAGGEAKKADGSTKPTEAEETAEVKEFYKPENLFEFADAIYREHKGPLSASAIKEFRIPGKKFHIWRVEVKVTNRVDGKDGKVTYGIETRKTVIDQTKARNFFTVAGRLFKEAATLTLARTDKNAGEKQIGGVVITNYTLDGQASPASQTPAPKAPAPEAQPKKTAEESKDSGAAPKGQAPAQNADAASGKKDTQVGVFASKKEAKEAKRKAKEFLKNLDHSLANINAKEFEIIDATYARYQRFMGTSEVKFEETAAIDETAFRKVVIAENQSQGSFTGGSRTGSPWVDIKIIIQGHPEVKNDNSGNYLEYKVKRKDVYGRSFSDMQWVRGMGPMPCTRSTEFIEITSEKTCRKYLDGNKAGTVEIQVTKEETNQLN